LDQLGFRAAGHRDAIVGRRSKLERRRPERNRKTLALDLEKAQQHCRGRPIAPFAVSVNDGPRKRCPKTREVIAQKLPRRPARLLQGFLRLLLPPMAGGDLAEGFETARLFEGQELHEGTLTAHMIGALARQFSRL
jgi:hypothetical protein